MNINNPPDFTRIIDTNGLAIRPTATDIGLGVKEVYWNVTNPLKRLVLQIGTWDMMTTPQKNVALPISIPTVKLLGVRVRIVNNAGTQEWPLDRFDDTANSGIIAAGFLSYAPSTFSMFTRIPGPFNNAVFAGASNRGYILVDYYE